MRRGQQHRRQRDRQQIERERPDQVHQARDDRVGPPSEESRDEREDQRHERGHQRGADPDQERGASAVEHTCGDIAPLVVGPEQVVGMPGRADRGLAEAELAAALLQHLPRLSVDRDSPRDVRLEWIRMSEVLRVEGSRKADRDNQDEEDECRECDPVARQAPAGKRPGAASDDRPAGLLGIEDDAFGFRLENSHAAPLPSALTSRTPDRAGSTTAG